MNIELLGEKILVKPITHNITAGGLFVPDNAENEPIKGEVIKIGNVVPENTGCNNLKEGDTIIWLPYAGTEFEYEGVKYKVIRPNDVIGKVSMLVN